MNVSPGQSLPVIVAPGEVAAGAPVSAPPVAGRPTLPVDPWRWVAAILRRWKLLLAAGLLGAAAAGTAGYFKFVAEYRSTAQLMRQEPSGGFRASDSGEPFKPRQLSVPTLVSFMKSPAVLQRVAERVQIPARGVAAGLTVTPERNTDLISLAYVSTRSPQTAVRVLNALGSEVVRLTREMQSQEAAEMNRLLKRQLTRAEEELRTVNREVLDFSRQAGLVHVDKEIDACLRNLGELDLKFESTRLDFETLDLRINALERELAAHNPLTERVQSAREKLAELLQQYTEANPLVQEQKSVVAELEARREESASAAIAPPRSGEGGLSAGFYAERLNLKTQKEVAAAQMEKLRVVRAGLEEKLRALPEKGMQLARIKARQQALEASQSILASRQREAQLYEENALGYYRFFDARIEEIETSGRGRKLLLITVAGAIPGFVLALLLVCLVESLDDRIKTVADLKRVTGLPLLARLPDLGTLDAVAQSGWAFRTWLALQARLVAGRRREVICGFAGAGRGEGISTWLELLGRAAAQRDAAVVVVGNRPPAAAAAESLDAALLDPGVVGVEPGEVRWLAVPSDWRWDAARRARWLAAVEAWSAVEGLVVLVELTGIEDPGTLALAARLPQVVWLSGCGVARAGATTRSLPLLQHAGGTVAGAVFNREVKLFPWT